MPQCYNEIWGPREMTPDGSVTALPGEYLHWRHADARRDTLADLGGPQDLAKGVFFFVLLGEGKDDPKAKPPEDANLQPILVKEATPVGFSGLLDRKGNPTPQCNEMSMLLSAMLRTRHC